MSVSDTLVHSNRKSSIYPIMVMSITRRRDKTSKGHRKANIQIEIASVRTSESIGGTIRRKIIIPVR